MIEHLEVLVEEASMEAALTLLLPKIVGDTSHTVHAHQGKADLLQRLPDRLQGYARWLPNTWRIVVVIDRDDENCIALKARLEWAAAAAGLRTRAAASAGSYQVANRIAVEELEAWFFGDWQAVRQAYRRVKAGVTRQAEYRFPDRIKGGTWEAMERILQAAGYFETRMSKIEAARAIAGHMDPARNSSPSFRAFRDVLQEMVAK